MSDIDVVVKYSKEIENLLSQIFGAEGRGLHEKATNASHLLPSQILKKIRYIATIRNKVIHESDYKIDDYLSFVSSCDEVVSFLNNFNNNLSNSHIDNYYKGNTYKESYTIEESYNHVTSDDNNQTKLRLLDKIAFSIGLLAGFYGWIQVGIGAGIFYWILGTVLSFMILSESAIDLYKELIVLIIKISAFGLFVFIIYKFWDF